MPSADSEIDLIDPNRILPIVASTSRAGSHSNLNDPNDVFDPAVIQDDINFHLPSSSSDLIHQASIHLNDINVISPAISNDHQLIISRDSGRLSNSHLLHHDITPSSHNHLKRGKKWQAEEDEQLCKSWLIISQELSTSTLDQRNGETFWARVTEDFLRSNPESRRPTRSIQQRWAKLQQSISQFGECYEEIESQFLSSTVSLDTETILVEALKSYKSKTDQNFSHYSCWCLLRHSNQWVDHLTKPKMLPTKRKLSNEDEAVNHHIPSHIIDRQADLTQINRVHQFDHDDHDLNLKIDQQKPSDLMTQNNQKLTLNQLKRNKRKKKVEDGVENGDEDERDKDGEDENENRSKLYQQRIIAIEELTKTMKQKVLALEEYNRLEREKNEIEIMSALKTPQSESWLKLKQQEILNRLMHHDSL